MAKFGIAKFGIAKFGDISSSINLRPKVGNSLYDPKALYFKPLGDARLWNVNKIYEKVGTVFRLV